MRTKMEELKKLAAQYLEENHISGDAMIKLSHDVDELPEEQQGGSVYLHDILASFAEKMKWEIFPSRKTNECEHPDDARIMDGNKDFCLACNKQVDK